MIAERKEKVKPSYDLIVTRADIPLNLEVGQTYYLELPYIIEIIQNGQPTKLMKKAESLFNFKKIDEGRGNLEEIAGIKIRKTEIDRTRKTTSIEYEVTELINPITFKRRIMD